MCILCAVANHRLPILTLLALLLPGCDTLSDKGGRFLEGTEPDSPEVTVPPAPPGPGEELPGPKVLALMIPGLEPARVERGMLEGWLPNLKRLRTRGTLTRMNAPRPPSPTASATTLLTGVGWEQHAVVGDVRRVIRDGRPVAVSSAYHVEMASRERLFPRGAPEGYPGNMPLVESVLGRSTLANHLDQAGKKALIVRAPIGFPGLAGPNIRVLGAGAFPDLSFGSGPYTFGVEDPSVPERRVTERGGIIMRLEPSTLGGTGDTFRVPVRGPPAPGYLDSVWITAQITLRVSKDRSRGTADSADHSVQLRAGQWSEPLVIRFEWSPGIDLFGRTRLYIRPTGTSRMELYIEPPDFVPGRTPPWLPLSYPASLAGELARSHGPLPRFATSFPGTALVDGVLDGRDAASAAESAFETEAKLFEALLVKGDFDLLLQSFSVVEDTARIGPGANEQVQFFGQRVERLRLLDAAVAAVDRLLGKAMAVVDSGHLGPEVTVMLVSPYGAQPATRFFDLNRFLVDRGDLYLRGPPDAPLGERIDWSRTKAYSLGYGGIYLNLEGREPNGVLPSNEASTYLSRLSIELEALTDPVGGKQVVKATWAYPEPLTHGESGSPDLLVGLAKGYSVDEGAAWFRRIGSLLGSTGNAVGGGFAANIPSAVPGMMGMTRVSIERINPSLQDLSATILALLDVPLPAGFEGKASPGARAMPPAPEENLHLQRAEEEEEDVEEGSVP